MAALTEILSDGGLNSRAVPDLSPEHRSSGERAPLSYAQERIWFLEQLGGMGTAYSSPFAWRLRGKLESGTLKAALADLVRRHETLRTRFEQSDNGPVQIVDEHVEFTLHSLDLSSIEQSVREAQKDKTVQILAEQPFDLGQGPLIRAHLIKLNDGDHVLLLNMHHIISDGWSLGVLTRELSELYVAIALERNPTIPASDVQYRDFAAWQRKWLRGAELDHQLDYWRHQLRGAPVALNLPTARPRPAVLGFEAGTVAVSLSRPLTEALNSVARRAGATQYMVLLSALQVVLARWSGQNDVVIGTPIAGRTHAQFANTIGFFVNTLPMRAQPTGRKSFAEFIEENKAAAIDAYAHQDIPFEKVVAELASKRETSRQPIVQALFAFQNVLQDALSLPGISTSRVAIPRKFTKFEITFLLEVIDGRVSGVIEFAARLFDEDMIRRLWSHVIEVLKQVSADGSLSIDDLDIVSNTERDALLRWSKGEQRTVNSDDHLFTQFERHACKNPERPAIKLGAETLSYGELSRRSNALAAQLRDRHCMCGQPVAVAMTRSPAAVVAMLAIVKAGAYYVPIDPTWPTSRVAKILKQLDIRLAIVDTIGTENIAQRFPGLQSALVNATVGGFDWMSINSVVLAAAERRAPTASLENTRVQSACSLAYVIFTSGSTGAPKGIAVTHQSAVNFIDWANRTLDLTPSDILLWVTPITFDLSVFDVFGTLSAGGQICLPTDIEAEEPAELAKIVASGRISVWNSAPAMLQQVAQFLPAEPRNAAGLRALITGGDWIPLTLPGRIHTTFPGCKFVASGGATEATVYSNYFIVDDVSPSWVSIPYGRPIQNTEYYILDDSLQLCPIDVEGDLYIAGAALALGYVGQHGLTAAAFMANPYGPPGCRMYATGDRACWSRDGQIEFRGRRDNQVKIRGYRVEISEVVGEILKLDQIRDAVVRATLDPNGDALLSAFFILENEGDKNVELDLRNLLRNTLPEYMIPTRCVSVDCFPVTSNGKVDTDALDQLTKSASTTEEIPEFSPLSQRLSELWTELLGRRATSDIDDFFELGAHSMTVARLCARVRAVWNIELPLRTVFDRPRLGELANEISRRIEASEPTVIQRASLAGGNGQIVPTPSTERVAASMAQERLWLISSLDPEGTLYSVPLAWRLRGALQRPALQAALEALVCRHESLRTRFEHTTEGPVQTVDETANFTIRTMDLSSVEEHEREVELQRRLYALIKEPFDLERGPLTRATLVTIGDYDHVLLLNAHHIVLDDWSVGILTEELSALYKSGLDGSPSPLPQQILQYRDFAQWQRNQLLRNDLRHQLDYWRRLLGDAPVVLDLPADKPRPAIATFKPGDVSVSVPSELTEKLTAIGHRTGATLYMVLLAAFQVVLARWSGKEDFVVGIASSSRPLACLERTVGFFVNTLPLRLRLTTGDTFDEVLLAVRENVIRAKENQEISFESIVEAVSPERDLSRHPLFQVAFDYQAPSASEFNLPGLEVTAIALPVVAAKFDLSMSLRATAGGLTGKLEYATDVFSAITMMSFVDSFKSVLDEIAVKPVQTVGDFELMSHFARGNLMRLAGEAQCTSDDSLFALDLFENCAANAPANIAVIHDDITLTYHQLDQWAECLADDFALSGIGPDTIVGLYVDRSPLMVAGLIAVLKAGGAYLPLDVNAPAHRIEQIIDQARPAIILTTEGLRSRLTISGDRLLIAPELQTPRKVGATRSKIRAKPASAAYVIFTSGSTGVPKGVVLTQQGLRQLADAQRSVLAIRRTDRLLQFARFAFDAATFEIFAALGSGATLILSERDRLLPGIELASLIRDKRVTVAVLPPAALPLLHGHDLASLRMIIAAGEALPIEEVRYWANAKPTLINAYGPSEATVWSTFSELSRHNGARAPIGRPIPGVNVYVLDDGSTLLPRGCLGELCLGGGLLARGYLGGSGVSAERYSANPFGPPGGRLYRTGDVVRWNEFDELEFHGRVDRQVKLRGFRVELTEIESALLVCEGISHAYAAVVGQNIVAYIVSKEPDRLDIDNIRSYLAAILPDYMMPAKFIPLEALPLDLNGKVDVRSLPSPFATSGNASGPETDLEHAISAIWQDVLQIDSVGMHQNFFDLGGTSLSLMKIFSMLKECPLVNSRREKLMPVDLFRYTTVRRLAAYLDAAVGPDKPKAKPRSVIARKRGPSLVRATGDADVR